MGKKAPKSTPRTTAINPQAVAHTFTAFSPSSDKATPLYYAHSHAAPDAHTLRVYSIDGKCVSRWASNAHGDEAASHGGDNSADEPRVRCIEWCSIPAAAADEAVAQQQAEGKRGKKRRKSDGGGAVDSPAKPTSESLRSSAASSAAQSLLASGLENGSISLWQPTGTQARTSSHPASNSPVTALAAPAGDATTGHLWSAHHDGSVRVWDLESGNVIGKVAGLAEESRWDDSLVRYEAPAADSGKRTVQLVLSHLSLHVYTVQVGGASKKEGKVRDLKATELGRCTGHVEPCSIRWTGSSSASSSAAAETDKLTFLSYAPMDRFVQVWQIPTTPASSAHIGSLLARLALDSGVASASVSPLAIPTLSSQTLAAVDSATGNVSSTTSPVFFSAESATPSKKGKKHGLGVVALDVQCEITAPAQGGRNEANVSEVAFRPEEDGKAILCRGGVKPVFEVVAFKEEGSWISKIELTRGAQGLLTANGTASSSGAPQTSRYSEQSTSAVAATAVAADADSDDDEVLGNAGELDVDMAEPTSADRLKALNVSQKKERKAAARKQRAIDADDDDVEVASESDDDDEEEFDLADEDDDLEGRAVPATTLTTTLIQASHSQDGPSLESCSTHSNPNSVRSTVKRLPSGGLVLSLLEASVERLGRQKKGREGLASVKRARALIAWLRETSVVHVGFLVTIPSSVNRLAASHASLTQRLALQPTSLALNGRLDLVMSQIDLRQDRARAASRRQQLAAASAAKKPSSGRRYVEGESTDEDEPHGDDDDDLSEGDVEDVVLGAGGSDDDEDSSDVDSDFLDEEDGEGGAPRHKRNGVESSLDLEAEDDEDFDEDEDEDDVSDDDDDDENAGEDSDFEA